MASRNTNGKRTQQNKPVRKLDGKGTGKQTPLEPKISLAPYIFGVLAGLLLLILILTDMDGGFKGSATGVVGYFICRVIYGLFGWGGWLIPFLLLYLALIWKRALASRTACAKCIASFVLLLMFSSLFYLFITLRTKETLPAYYNIAAMWKLSVPTETEGFINCGGILGALFGGVFYTLFRVVAWLIVLLILLFSLLVLIEITPVRAVRIIANHLRILRERIAERREAAKERKAQKASEKEAEESAESDEAETRDRPRIFPEQPAEEERPAPAPAGKRRSVSISPLHYDKVSGESVNDPEITETVPPVLSDSDTISKENAQKAEKVPAGAGFRDPNPYVNARSGQTVGKSAEAVGGGAREDKPSAPTDGEVAPTEGLYDFLFQNQSDRPVMQEKPPVGGSDVNVIPKNPVYGDSSAFDAEDSAADTETAEKTTEEIFAEITDLQESDDNDHALTDPDFADPEEEITVKPEYRFPPLTLLHKDIGGINADHSAELQANGVKLVSTLESFKVKTKITNISRGPTITRYELMPDQGVRVRAIANLVDDIALNLATSGVRIEAPIPGKPAVGIEVPNSVAETVYLRDLLENPKFEQASSKVTAALGMDVAGDPIFVDIAKMPHLLIAGTTGSGKSVCINSLITSLLFRATPEEVKLILIDPKKVELGVYNRLPHLLVPVVTNPKKAAGALTWAVSEMEKRYEMIEEAGVRDIKGYNRQVEDGEIEGEKMPSIIIVIDELADLMMTAPDTVEESVCRLAQKARAAGMHLIIGTQRPSVDVITGLIKANIPSRIAFTVKSNVDSRTIIDIAGAEKLIGHGDMLYAPVGAMKPIRVQGAFVSDKEVEAVCDFIREEAGEVSYDQKTLDEIREHEAECEELGKKSVLPGSDDSDDEEDPKFAEAVRVAVESGKISTSLLQRRLALGYGRAAKIIDRMEKMGIVSAPDGQKPRNVLINMQDYQEMILKRKEDL
ncbi:MAG: DNA translocase FtsK [Eubacteriales bacterium]